MVPSREPPVVRVRQEQLQRMDIRGRAERRMPSMQDGEGYSVIKGQHMMVCVKRARERQAGWHRRKFLHPVPAEIAGTGFFVMKKHRVYLKTPDAPGQRVFSRCAAPFFLEIRQYSCEKTSCAAQKLLAAGHIGSFQIHPSKIRNAPFPRPCGATGKDAQILHAPAFAHFCGAVLTHEAL